MSIHHVKPAGAYQYTVFAPKFIKAGRVCRTLRTRTTLLIGTVEDLEVV